jgi:transcriptional regulator with XRE-family HTH domain
MGRLRHKVDTSTYAGRFAERLRMLREKTGFSVEEMAEQTGIPRATLFSWENGSRSPISNDLLKLAEFLGCNVRSLLPKE